MNRKNDADAEARFQERMQALRAAYAERQLEMISDVLAAYGELADAKPETAKASETLDALVFTAHSLAGSAGTFEYEDIARTAIAIEDEARRLRAGGDGDLRILEVQTGRLKAQLEGLREIADKQPEKQ